MEPSVTRFQSAIKQLLSGYERLKTEHSKVVLLFDDERMQYMAARVGWLNQTRVHFCLVHIEISDDAVIIHCNNTEDPVASELVELGISPEKILLGFLPPEHQSFAALRTNLPQLQPA